MDEQPRDLGYPEGCWPGAAGQRNAIHRQDLRAAVQRHLFSETDARNAFDRVLPTYEEVGLHQIDFVIEAAIEKLDLKQQIFADLESKVPSDLVLASNTSALSIDAIAASLQHPERVVGIHFFNPVHRMQLVEIVRGKKTNAATLNTAIRFVKQIGKLPVLVKDSPGFLSTESCFPTWSKRYGCSPKAIALKRLTA